MDEWIAMMKEAKDALAGTCIGDAIDNYEHLKFAATDLCKQDWYKLRLEHNNMQEAVNYYMLKELFHSYTEIKSTYDAISLAKAMELDEDLRQYCVDHDGKNIAFGAVKYRKPFMELQDLMSQAVKLYEQRNP